MGKVKAHRVLKDIDIKGLISIEKYDKTNHITLSENVKVTISRMYIVAASNTIWKGNDTFLRFLHLMWIYFYQH